MFKFLFAFIFFIVLMTLLLGFSFLRTLSRILFGGGGAKKTQRQSGNTSRQTNTHQKTAPNKKKIIPREEGEYVDYEEIK
jgi:hypothetical protein